MGEKVESSKYGRENAAERGTRFFRNINAVGAVALGGAAILVPPLAAPLSVWAGINAVQAGGFEAARRYSKKKRIRKQTGR